MTYFSNSPGLQLYGSGPANFAWLAHLQGQPTPYNQLLFQPLLLVPELYFSLNFEVRVLKLEVHFSKNGAFIGRVRISKTKSIHKNFRVQRGKRPAAGEKVFGFANYFNEKCEEF